MATVDLNHVHFWQPPKPSLHQQHTLPRKHSMAASATTSRNQPVAATRQRGRDFEAQPEDEEVEAQGRIHDPTNSDDDADDTFLSIEELLDPLLRKEIAATGCQGTRDRPVILEEDEGDSPDHTADSETTSTSVNTSPVPAVELSQGAVPSNREPWWDVEEGCFVYEDLHPLPLLDHKGLASTPAQDQPPSHRHSLGVSQDQIKPHGDNRTTRSASEESAAQSLIITLDEDGGRESEENVSDLERDMQLAFEEQEELLATSPSSPHRLPLESSHPSSNQDCDRGWSEELQSSSGLLCSQEKEKEKEDPREQEQEEMATDEIRHKVLEQELEEADNSDDSGEREQRGEKRQHQDKGINTSIQHSERSGYDHDKNDDDDEDDEEDENPQHTKRRRLSLAPPDMPPTPPLEQSSPNPHSLAQAHSATPSSTTQFEIGNAQSQTDLAHPPASINNDHHFTPPSSRNPSDTEESASGADFHEWPFHGFLKRVTIGNQITYNLEFSLSHVPEHLCLSLHSEVLSTSSRESSVEAPVSRRAVTSRKPGKELTKNQERLLAKMVHDDKTWAEIGRHFPGHTMQSLKDNFFTKQGGKPRKRGRKPGVRTVGV
ncbi:hypothetical protein BKA61DRAFT_680954 [Leptodontidium sp. MPI-SDFR-AT-0119]|nr:hypothetical protein BKA61DRAFT_680954 [Leptodontidium sp. MPI-SDFR-AT-0119]